MANTYISRSISASPTNPDKFTISMWVKRCKLGAEQSLMGQYASSNFRGKLSFLADDRIEYIQKNDGNTTANLITTRKFRDTFGYYHLLVQFDTSQGTDSNRIKIYINGTQETAFDTSSYPAQNLDMRLNQASGTLCIGQDGNGGNYCDLILSHVHLVDGATEAPTVFGEYDANGVWKIKTSPSISEYGDDGFFVLKDGNSVTDQSGKGNNFTVAGGTLTKTEDSPSNVFATLNPNYQSTFHATSRATLANGNTKWTGSSNNTGQNAILSTLGASSGKWYLEVKWVGTEDSQLVVAKSDFGMMTAGSGGFQSAGWYGMITNISNTGGSGMAWWSNNSATGDRGNTISTNDIIMMAIDIDNSKLYFGKNGTWEESGDPTSGATGTGATSTLASDTTYLVGCSNYGYSTANSWEFNFGNGYFGSTQISSAGTNASGIGIFEYDVPTGYTALSTKGLNL